MESEGPDTSPAVSVASPEAVRNAAREAALQRSQQVGTPTHPPYWSPSLEPRHGAAEMPMITCTSSAVVASISPCRQGASNATSTAMLRTVLPPSRRNVHLQQASLPSKQQLLDRQRLDETEHQLSKLLFSTVMDYRHAAPADVHSCVQILHKLLSNVLHHPDDAALRQVRATSKAFLRLQAINGSDSFLRESGWRSRTVDFKPFWIYECRPATLQWGVLERAVKLLGKAEAVSHDKLERLQAEESERREKKLATSAERQRVLAQFKDDHLLRS